MRFMNDYDMYRAIQLHGHHPVLGPACETLIALATWADNNSDGWAHWPKPARSAAKLMELITNANAQWHDGREPDTTAEQYRAALRPIKAFRTRHGANFVIAEPK